MSVRSRPLGVAPFPFCLLTCIHGGSQVGLDAQAVMRGVDFANGPVRQQIGAHSRQDAFHLRTLARMVGELSRWSASHALMATLRAIETKAAGPVLVKEI